MWNNRRVINPIDSRLLASGDSWQLIANDGVYFLGACTRSTPFRDSFSSSEAVIEFRGVDELRPLCVAVMAAMLEDPGTLETYARAALYHTPDTPRPRLRLLRGLGRKTTHDDL